MFDVICKRPQENWNFPWKKIVLCIIVGIITAVYWNSINIDFVLVWTWFAFGIFLANIFFSRLPPPSPCLFLSFCLESIFAHYSISSFFISVLFLACFYEEIINSSINCCFFSRIFFSMANNSIWNNEKKKRFDENLNEINQQSPTTELIELNNSLQILVQLSFPVKSNVKVNFWETFPSIVVAT